jgi:hypothetical protein
LDGALEMSTETRERVLKNLAPALRGGGMDYAPLLADACNDFRRTMNRLLLDATLRERPTWATIQGLADAPLAAPRAAQAAPTTRRAMVRVPDGRPFVTLLNDFAFHSILTEPQACGAGGAAAAASSCCLLLLLLWCIMVNVAMCPQAIVARLRVQQECERVTSTRLLDSTYAGKAIRVNEWIAVQRDACSRVRCHWPSARRAGGGAVGVQLVRARFHSMLLTPPRRVLLQASKVLVDAWPSRVTQVLTTTLRPLGKGAFYVDETDFQVC